MIKKLYENHETAFCLVLIAVYVIINSVCLQSFDTTDLRCALVNLVFSGILLALILHLRQAVFYGLKCVREPRQYAWFLPLVLIASVNLWGGISARNSTGEILIHVITMLSVGFSEEIIFRGFLFRMVEKSNLRAAMLVSALTFGLGHIVNLLNGAAVLPTLLQLCYAAALGWLFVVIFHKSGSLLPCILTHGVLNALSIFCVESEIVTYAGSALLILVSLGYAAVLGKTAGRGDISGTEPNSGNAAGSN